LRVPRITSVSTYRQEVWVYFDLQYADPGKDARPGRHRSVMLGLMKIRVPARAPCRPGALVSQARQGHKERFA
jgi:hypothetical protein